VPVRPASTVALETPPTADVSVETKSVFMTTFDAAFTQLPTAEAETARYRTL
jgi:hypothetical protein